jgi:glycosyltransferase involved in cell wall biosynthesis
MRKGYRRPRYPYATLTLRAIDPGESLSLARGTPAVCVYIPEGGEGGAETLRTVVAHTPAGTALIIAAAQAQVDELGGGEAAPGRVLTLAAGTGFDEVLRRAAAIAGEGDLALVSAGTLLGPGWLARLAAAAHSDGTVVTATPLHPAPGWFGVTVDVPARAEAQARAVADDALRAYPRVEAAGAHCVYIRRQLLDLVDPPPGGNAAATVAALSRAALARGMLHVAADDVFVGLGGAARDMCPLGEHERGATLRRSVAWARISLRQRLAVTIDARALGAGVGGTQRYAFELILALAASDRLSLRAVTPPDLPESVAVAFSGAGVEVVPYEQAVAGPPPSDVVHRPQQVFSEHDLALLGMLGERIVVGQQDLIAYRDPAYHESEDAWRTHRRVTRIALGLADRVVFFSEHARTDAVGEDLVSPSRADVCGIGTGLSMRDSEPPSRPPALEGAETMIACVGADYAHKNRPFAIELLRALVEREGWDGSLVLAGGHVPYGSSREEERRLLGADRTLAERVVDLGPISEGEKAWLYANARALVYPTLYEGFGLIPFEAAAAGTPCLYAAQASLAELAGEAAATLVPWSAERSAAAAAPLLRDGPERAAHLALLSTGAARASWPDTVERLIQTYTQAVAQPFRTAARRARQELERETLLATFARNAEANNRAYNELRDSVAFGLPLIEEGGMLTRDEQRGLMRAASRRALRPLAIAPFGLLGRLGRGGSRSPGRGADDAAAGPAGASRDA